MPGRCGLLDSVPPKLKLRLWPFFCEYRRHHFAPRPVRAGGVCIWDGAFAKLPYFVIDKKAKK